MAQINQATLDTGLRVLAVGLPLAGALIIWRLGDRLGPARSWLAVALFGVVGLAALALFLAERQYACTFALGRQSCLIHGLASLSLVALNALFVWRTLAAAGAIDSQDTALMLLFVAAWAGVGLASELLVFLVSLNLLIFAVNRWLNRRGLKLRYLLMRDDYKDG